MKLIFDYKFRFYTSKMNEICLHCHWLYFSSIILSFGQCAGDKVWLIHLLSSVINLGTVISRILYSFLYPIIFYVIIDRPGVWLHTKQAQWNLRDKKKNKFVCSFFGRIYGTQICLRFYLTFSCAALNVLPINLLMSQSTFKPFHRAC